MSAGTSLCLTLLFVVFISAEQTIITAESGDDVTLPCRAPNNDTIVKWRRDDLGDKYVFLYQDKPDSGKQHPSFKNRVVLQDIQMKDGDVSLILKNVTINDAGTYVCAVYMEEKRLWNNSNIKLVVVPPEAAGEDVETRVKSFIKTHLKLPEDTVKNIAFDRVHRIGPIRTAARRPRSIVAKFGHFKQKEQVKSRGRERNGLQRKQPVPKRDPGTTQGPLPNPTQLHPEGLLRCHRR
ncbi:uncharacterized protein LOC120715421 [Simochromis diagramma]|uniref:uncharacterized protein LOC120715421 n=1 Tax=Simochromis diagramma TaxID=43689 RepID=UPI001A7EBC0F|nr:uncharacterized protein LOC120715421 [Simochromis diagramma]